MFFDEFQSSISREELRRDWLHSPGLPRSIRNLRILAVDQSDISSAYDEVIDCVRLSQKRRRNCEISLDQKLNSSCKVVLLFNRLIQYNAVIPPPVLREVMGVYESDIRRNVDVGHRQ